MNVDLGFVVKQLIDTNPINETLLKAVQSRVPLKKFANLDLVTFSNEHLQGAEAVKAFSETTVSARCVGGLKIYFFGELQWKFMFSG